MKSTFLHLKRRCLLPAFLTLLACGCATSQTGVQRQAADAPSQTPFWQFCLGWLLGFVAGSAYDYGRDQQRIQSGDPTR